MAKLPIDLWNIPTNGNTASVHVASGSFGWSERRTCNANCVLHSIMRGRMRKTRNTNSAIDIRMTIHLWLCRTLKFSCGSHGVQFHQICAGHFWCCKTYAKIIEYWFKSNSSHWLAMRKSKISTNTQEFQFQMKIYFSHNPFASINKIFYLMYLLFCIYKNLKSREAFSYLTFMFKWSCVKCECYSMTNNILLS